MRFSRAVLDSFNHLKVTPPNIQNINVPICINCQFFIPDKKDPISYGKCNQFGTKCMVTGNFLYTSAQICRQDDMLCGNTGKRYKELPDPRENFRMKPIYTNPKMNTKIETNVKDVVDNDN